MRCPPATIRFTDKTAKRLDRNDGPTYNDESEFWTGESGQMLPKATSHNTDPRIPQRDYKSEKPKFGGHQSEYDARQRQMSSVSAVTAASSVDQISVETHRIIQELKGEIMALDRKFKERMKREDAQLEEAKKRNRLLKQKNDSLSRIQQELNGQKSDMHNSEKENEARKAKMYELAQMFKQKMLDEKQKQHQEMERGRKLESQIRTTQHEVKRLQTQLDDLEKASLEMVSKLESEIKDVRWQTKMMLDSSRKQSLVMSPKDPTDTATIRLNENILSHKTRDDTFKIRIPEQSAPQSHMPLSFEPVSAQDKYYQQDPVNSYTATDSQAFQRLELPRSLYDGSNLRVRILKEDACM